MGNLYFPQLSSGALAQYPIKKARLFRTIKNVLPDGSLFLAEDPGYSRWQWNLSYSALSPSDVQAIQAHFSACKGPLHAFTFVDPTDNMLPWSSDLSNSHWQASPLIHLQAGAADPLGGANGFVLTNTAENSEEFTQTLAVPANFTYCLSMYIARSSQATVGLIRRGSESTQPLTVNIGPTWTRAVSAGQLIDSGSELTVGVSLSAGQQISIFGPQLEAQPAPSEYRSTAQISGVHPNSHWTVGQLSIEATAPDLYSTAFTIETID